MAAQINTNLYSLNAQRNLSKNSQSLSTSIERLSSGLRVNSAKDDAAGLAVSMKMDSYARGISASIRQANDGISQAQIADGALSTVNDMLQRMSELAAQAQGTTLTTNEQAYLNKEYQALNTSIATIQGNAKMNGQTAFATTYSSVTAPAGNITNSAAATAAATLVSQAIDQVANSRAEAGAAINNLNFQIQSYEANYENQMAAKSRITDADFAQETSNLSRGQILQQAGTAMIAQANQLPQNVLTLLR